MVVNTVSNSMVSVLNSSFRLGLVEKLSLSHEAIEIIIEAKKSDIVRRITNQFVNHNYTVKGRKYCVRN